MKYMRYLLTSVLAVSAIFLSCECGKTSSGAPPPGGDNSCTFNGVDTCNGKPAPLTLTVDLNQVQQTIHSFGASDGWTCKFIGKWANESKKNYIADLLFSMDTLPDGNPKGIGLSLWRFNIGAGSYEQGDSSGIATDWRREECFLNADGTYNWSKQAGQQWFLNAARQRGVRYTLGFALSPPVSMTKNGRAYNTSGTTSLNIADGRLPDFADFLAETAQHLQLDYVSPVNEPQWTWGTAGVTAGQEGSQAQNAEIADLVKALSAKLSPHGASAKTVIGEAGQWDFLTGKNSDGRGDQINQFFSPSSPNYIGNVPNTQHAISSHSYYTTCPDNTLIEIRQQVAARVKQVDPSLETWMTEFGILGNICGVLNGSPRTTDIDYGLYVAKTIHHDLTVTGVTSWQWWLAVSPYNYSDGLVYINDPSGTINVDNCKLDGIVLDSKQLWSLGNFSRFIRPGMKRIAASIQGMEDPATAAQSLMVSAYKDDTNKTLVIVIVNYSTRQDDLRLTGVSGPAAANLNTYTTDRQYGLHRSETAAGDIVIGPRSIVTLTGTYQ
ncbi:MAG TPA: glycoside hydrolase [Puia sp.]|nr:glycoside hydrolase [Puia sp.]